MPTDKLRSHFTQNRATRLKRGDSQGVKALPANAGDVRDVGSTPSGVGKIPWRRKWQPAPVFLPGESHGLTSLVGYSPWGCKESYTTRPACHQHHPDALKREGQGNSGPPLNVTFAPVFKDMVDTAQDRQWGINRRPAQVDSTHGHQHREAGSS